MSTLRKFARQARTLNPEDIDYTDMDALEPPARQGSPYGGRPVQQRPAGTPKPSHFQPGLQRNPSNNPGHGNAPPERTMQPYHAPVKRVAPAPISSQQPPAKKPRFGSTPPASSRQYIAKTSQSQHPIGNTRPAVPSSAHNVAPQPSKPAPNRNPVTRIAIVNREEQANPLDSIMSCDRFPAAPAKALPERHSTPSTRGTDPLPRTQPQAPNRAVNPLRMVPISIANLERWLAQQTLSGDSSPMPILFEVFGTVAEDHGSSNAHCREFVLQDLPGTQRAGSIKCEYWEIDSKLPPMQPNTQWRIVAHSIQKTANGPILCCVHARPIRPDEKKYVHVLLGVGDAFMRRPGHTTGA